MTINLPAEQGSILSRLVSLGRFASAEEAIVEAVRRLEADEAIDHLNPKPLSAEDAEQIYGADDEWEKVERSMAGRARPEV
jgi:Arc/MetJ-type ribon-helix-helix transcriptional regulator